MTKHLKRASFTGMALILVLSFLGGSYLTAQAATTIFINEIHYDNTGADADEAIEVAGPAGTDLTGWSLVLYNGSGGAVYNTTALSGTIPNQDNGYGTLSFLISGIQNGNPDGVALVNPSNTLIQFLSYEGSFTAVGGPANGLTSTDIGVSEPGSTPVGYSLQLTGTGSQDDDFTWVAAAAATFGAVNTGQSFNAPAPNIIINEIMQNPAAVADASGEWFELYNNGSTAVDIDGWTIADNDIDSHVINNGGPLLIPAGGYLVLGNNIDSGTNGGASVDYNYGGSWYLANGADEVVLLDGSLVEIDRVEYDGGPVFPDPTGASMSLTTPALDNNVGANWCTSTTSFGIGDLGTPGAVNNCGAPPPDIVINEIMQNPAAVGDSSGEWFELYNNGSTAVDINGWTIADNDTDSHVINNGGPLLIPAGGYLVLGINADAGTNGGASVNYAYSSWTLANGADEVVLYDDSLVEMDRVEYDGGPVFPDPNGASMSLSSTALDNNVGANWCTSTTAFGAGDLGTPGSANTCTSVATGMIINELDADTVGVDTLEFVELYDGGTGNTDLSGLVLVLYNGNNDLSYSAIDLDGYTTDGSGYFVAGNTLVSGVDLTFADGLLQNGADAVALYAADSADFPANTPVTTTNLLDAIVYDTADADDPGLLVLLNTGQPQVDEDGGIDKDTESLQRCPNGSGGQRNTTTYTQRTPSPGTANACQNIDLQLTKTANPSNVFETNTVVYTLTVENASLTQDATGVVVRDYLPDTSTEVENVTLGICSQGSIASVAANSIEWTVGTLTGGASATCTISADIRTGTDGTTLYNYAEVYSVTETTDLDSTPGNFSVSPAEDDESGAAVSVGTPAACGSTATLISAIQGSGALSPEDGNIHTIEGVMVGDFQTSTALRGFFLQEETAQFDADPATSEGVFVYDGNTPAVDVNVGDWVRVTGTVDEYLPPSSSLTLTEITTISDVTICGNGFPTAPTPVTLPVVSLDTWEQYEGMLITIPQTLYVTGNYTQGRYGEVDLSAFSRLYNPTNVTTPGAAALALQAVNDLSRIQLEDGRTAQNPDPTPYLGVDNTLRAGDTLDNLVGVLNYAFDYYELHPTSAASFTRVNARPAAPPDVGGTLKVASYNVLNYFVTLGSRGADNAAEFARQQAKIINAIIEMDADVVGLMEIENHATDNALTDLINGLNAATAPGTYAAINTGVIGTDAIKVALIYKPGTVSPSGAYAILDSSVDPTFLDTKNRPALAQTFEQVSTGEKFTVAVNHLKSKGSDCLDVGDPDTGDGQGNCNITRTNAAIALANWLGTDPTASGDPDFLIIGDLNAYAMEDPITALKNNGYYNLIERFLGLDAYSYVFYGQAGYLDHALANLSLKLQVTGVGEWHINADEPVALDYNDYNPPSNYSPDEFASSDHDPVLIGLALGNPPVAKKTNPKNGENLTSGPVKIIVEFNKPVKSDFSAQAANNIINYLLLEAQGDGFQTGTCAEVAASGVAATDTSIVINSISYNSSTYTATLWINSGSPLAAGTYRLTICGTTSIEDLAGLELNSGESDTVIEFTVGDATDLPATGFAPGTVTALPAQPLAKQYDQTSMLLSIPKLGLQMPIMGVPLTETGWDVTWLGSSAGYLEGSAFPTWNGNTVLTGHVWGSQNQPGPFANLKDLGYGDRFEINAWGQTYVYEVRETALVRPWQVGSVLQHEDYDWVTLLTCEDFRANSDSYSYRRVVRAVLVEVK